MSSPIGQEAAFGVYQNSDRFKVKFSTLSYWHGVRTVNIATLWPAFYALTHILDILKLAPHSKKYRIRKWEFNVPTASYVSTLQMHIFSTKFSSNVSNLINLHLRIAVII